MRPPDTVIVEQFLAGSTYGQLARRHGLTLGQVSGIIHRSGRRRPAPTGRMMTMINALREIARGALEPSIIAQKTLNAIGVPLEDGP